MPIPFFDLPARVRDNTPMTRLKDKDFAARVGCHYSMASRLRRGERMPSRVLLRQIIEAFDLSAEAAFNAWTAGPVEFSRFLNENVFQPVGDSPNSDRRTHGDSGDPTLR